MNRTIPSMAVLLSLSASPLACAQPKGGFPIERSHPTISEPLASDDVKHLASGDPPPVFFQYWLGNPEGQGLFRYLKAKRSYQHALAELGFAMKFTTDFSAAAAVKAKDAEGMVITRDTKGTIVKAGTQRDWFFVRSQKNMIAIEWYLAKDCSADENGEVKPLPGVPFANRSELRQISYDSRNKTRVFQIISIVPDVDPSATKQLEIVLSEPKGRSQVVLREYIGLDPKDRKLILEDRIERIFWPEGPGYRQIIRTEKYSDDQSDLVKHVVEKWRVNPAGEQQKIDEQDLLQQPEEEPSEEEPSDEELH